MKTSIRHARLILSRLKLAYRRRCAYITYSCIDSSNLVYFLQKLQKWGVISHFELTRKSALVRRGYTGRPEFRLFLRYVDQKPVVCFWGFGALSQATHVLSYNHLHRLAWYQPGIFFVIRTKLGLLPITDCLTHRCGGVIFLAIRAA